MKVGSESKGAATTTDSKNRFSSRVENYVKYRPGYPAGVMRTLRDLYGITGDMIVADVGAGTGISTALFLENGNTVYAIEPNAEMRAAAERAHAVKPGFHSINGSGEATTLADRSVDLVFCAQAFHWLDRTAAAAEFRRILKPGGIVAIVWNERRRAGSGFLAEYEAFLQEFGTDYKTVSARETTADDFTRLFGSPFQRYVFPNIQQFDLEGLRGRILSSSYVPLPGTAHHDDMMRTLPKLFEKFAKEGKVDFEYETEMFISKL